MRAPCAPVPARRATPSPPPCSLLSPSGIVRQISACARLAPVTPPGFPHSAVEWIWAREKCAASRRQYDAGECYGRFECLWPRSRPIDICLEKAASRKWTARLLRVCLVNGNSNLAHDKALGTPLVSHLNI